MQFTAHDEKEFQHVAELAYKGHYLEAHNKVDAIYERNREKPMVRFCMARLKIALGDWFPALDMFESVRGYGFFGGDFLTNRVPLWAGESLVGKKIAVVCEGGLGDIICFSRFSKNLRELGADPILLAPKETFPLFRTLQGHPYLAEQKTHESLDFDYWVPSLSLPKLLKIAHQDIDGEPYLVCPQMFLEKWQRIFLATSKKIKVGLIWQGNPAFAEDHLRSIKGSSLQGLLSIANVQFVTLQSNHPQNSWQDSRLLDFGHLVREPSDLAGFCSQLDLLISVDSAPAHIAGALGVPVVLLNRIFGWWTFANAPKGISKTPWYNSMQVLQQTHGETWDTEISFLKNNLLKLVQSQNIHSRSVILHPQNPKPSAVDYQLVNTRYGKLFTVPNDFFVGRALLEYGEYSQDEMNVVGSLLKKDDVVLDVGAHLGYTTAFMSHCVGATGRVLAFEPQDFLRKCLELNKTLHNLNNVDIYSKALGDVSGTLYMEQNDYHSVGNFGAVSLSDSNKGVPVQVVTIDELNLKKVDFIKMDIEGMEFAALKGAKNTLLRCRPQLWIEFDREEQKQDIVRFLAELNYNFTIHTTPLFKTDNYRGQKHNIFGQSGTVNIHAWST